ncbi:MAG: hypothetical protein ACI8RD_000099, partial [Bacillariaceae sp.]
PIVKESSFVEHALSTLLTEYQTPTGNQWTKRVRYGQTQIVIDFHV